MCPCATAGPGLSRRGCRSHSGYAPGGDREGPARRNGARKWRARARPPGLGVRTADGELKVVARRKRFRAADVRNPVLRGPARIAEVFTLLPQVKRALPEAQLPMERPRVLASVVGSAVVLRGLRNSSLRPLSRELITGLLSIAPAVFALRGGDLAAYHGAEHVSIGTYEHGESRPKEHERCGSHLIGPMLLTNAAGNLLAEQAPTNLRPAAKLAATIGSLAPSVAILHWSTPTS